MCTLQTVSFVFVKMRILSEEDLKKALSMKETIDVNKEAFVSLSSGEAQVLSNCRIWTLKSLTLHFTPNRCLKDSYSIFKTNMLELLSLNLRTCLIVG